MERGAGQIVGLAVLTLTLFSNAAFHMIALIADGDLHLVDLYTSGHSDLLLIDLKGVEDLVPPVKSGLIGNSTLPGTHLKACAGNC